MYRRGLFVGRGACPLFSWGECFARPVSVVRNVLCAHRALSSPGAAARRIRGGDRRAVLPRGQMGAGRGVRALLYPLRGDARGVRRAFSRALAPPFAGRAFYRAFVFAERDERDLFPQLHARPRPRGVCVRIRGAGNVAFPDGRKRGDGRAVCGDERPARRSRSARRGAGCEAPRAFGVFGNFGRFSLRLFCPRGGLSGGGGRARGRTSLSLRHAREPHVLRRLRARHSHLARLGALSASEIVRGIFFRAEKERRKGGRTPCGVRVIEAGPLGHRSRPLSRVGGDRACLFSSLYFLRVSFREAPPKSTSPRQGHRGPRSPSSQGRA